jgi:hypothetical protein
MTKSSLFWYKIVTINHQGGDMLFEVYIEEEDRREKIGQVHGKDVKEAAIEAVELQMQCNRPLILVPVEEKT